MVYILPDCQMQEWLLCVFFCTCYVIACLWWVKSANSVIRPVWFQRKDSISRIISACFDVLKEMQPVQLNEIPCHFLLHIETVKRWFYRLLIFKYCIIDYIINNSTEYKETYVYRRIYFLICILQCQKIFNDNLKIHFKSIGYWWWHSSKPCVVVKFITSFS